MVSLENGCKMCVGVHKQLARVLGMNEEQIAEIDGGIDNINCSEEEKILVIFLII